MNEDEKLVIAQQKAAQAQREVEEAANAVEQRRRHEERQQAEDARRRELETQKAVNELDKQIFDLMLVFDLAAALPLMDKRIRLVQKNPFPGQKYVYSAYGYLLNYMQAWENSSRHGGLHAPTSNAEFVHNPAGLNPRDHDPH